MIGISSVAGYIPQESVDNLERAGQFGVSRDFIENKTGMLRVSRRAQDEETSSMCCEAVSRLLERTGAARDEIGCLVVCTQNPDGYGLPHTSAIVHGKMGLARDCAVFDISLGCSGFVYGLSIVKSFMEGNGIDKGILVTADPYSKVIDETDKNTSLLFGDAASATLLTSDPAWEIGAFCFGSDGSRHEAIAVDAESGLLNMNGRGVFTFTSTVVPGNITRTLELNNLGKDDISLFLLHQGSRFIRDTLIKRLGLPEEKTPFLAADYGNTVSSSIPLMLEEYLNEEGNILISGFGVGLSWGSCVLKRKS